ncbi:MAG: 5-formyltetrahydrofolate cyclo-ligase [Kiritimatiellia bacterium]
MTTKAELRKQLRAELRALSTEEKASQSAALCERLLSDPELPTLQHIGIYLPLADEPDLLPAFARLLEKGVHLAVPFPLDPLHWEFRRITELTTHRTRPDTPDRAVSGPVVDPAKLQAVLVPGRGFTPDGHRLGRGGGIYDRLLSHTSARTIGIGFSCQRLDRLPVEPHDVSLNEVWFP